MPDLRIFVGDGDTLTGTPLKAVTGDYTVTSADVGKILEVTGPATITFPDDDEIKVEKIVGVRAVGPGAVVIDGAVGVTVRNEGTIAQQWATVAVQKRGAAEWIVDGAIAQELDYVPPALARQASQAGIGNPGPNLFDQRFAIATLPVPASLPAGAVLGFSASFIVTTATTGALILLQLASATGSGNDIGGNLSVASATTRTVLITGTLTVQDPAGLVLLEYRSDRLNSNGSTINTPEQTVVGAVPLTRDLTSGLNLYVVGKVGSNTANDFVVTRNGAALWRVA